MNVDAGIRDLISCLEQQILLCRLPNYLPTFLNYSNIHVEDSTAEVSMF